MIVVDGRIQFNCDLETIYRKVMLPKSRKLHVKITSPSDPCAQNYLINPVVNHNKWIAECPWCHNAEFIWLESPMFMCQNCWNGVANHQWIKIILPSNLEKIHEILIKRPVPATRNWFVGETHEDLYYENLEHGLDN